jgi:2-polyprenyl-3-methyl-5-hydroxy-6-metoxy-1,4-benzoquinol methylase
LTGGFAPDEYWERRLREHFDLEGVGYLRLGRRYNEWMYRVRGEVFDRVVGELLGQAGGRAGGRAGGQADRGAGGQAGRRAGGRLRVLDVGSGTGFYVDRWLALGADVTGLDLTEVAIQRLRKRFPSARFTQANIGQPLAPPLAAEVGEYDVVSAFDVLFHVVDDREYQRALENIGSVLRPGGWFLWSDNFIHQATVRIAHQVSRSLDEITRALARAGFEIVTRVPMFVLMNYPADTASRIRKWVWTALMTPAMVSDRLGGWLGAALYPLERRLVASRRESPSTELMVCRRR